MAVSEKAKEKLDEASKEIKEAIESLKKDVAELTNKVKEKLRGTGEEMREPAEGLTREVKTLSEKVKDLIPKRRRRDQLPVRVERSLDYPPDAWERRFLELRNATDRLFDDFFREFQLPGDRRSRWGLTRGAFDAGWPRADMVETDEEIRITAELPGVGKDDIDVSVTDGRVIIRGEKKEEREKEERGLYAFERSYGTFQRSFDLPCEVESDRVDASFKDGVLTVNLPKTAAARERLKKIPIRTG
jgi:HSP20 family protein